MWHNLKTEEVARGLKTSLKLGLAKEEAIKRREKYGDNKLQEKKKESIFVKFHRSI
jgi:Ca2+-transporting ATPase